jgi:hypothetical protein
MDIPITHGAFIMAGVMAVGTLLITIVLFMVMVVSGEAAMTADQATVLYTDHVDPLLVAPPWAALAQAINMATVQEVSSMVTLRHQQRV